MDNNWLIVSSRELCLKKAIWESKKRRQETRTPLPLTPPINLIDYLNSSKEEKKEKEKKEEEALCSLFFSMASLLKGEEGMLIMMEPLLTLIPPAIIFVSLKILQRDVYDGDSWCFLKYFFI